MRPLLALLLSLAIFGVVGGYMQFLHRVQSELPPPSTATNLEQAQGNFSLDVTLTFDAAGQGAFALDPSEAAALTVRLRGHEVLRIEEPIAAGTPITVEQIEGITPGPNEFYLEAHPADEGRPVAHAVRVRVFRNGHPLGEQTLWSEPGLPVRGTVWVEVQEDSAAHAHG